MKVGILVAMDKELSLVLKMMPNYDEITIGGIKYYKGFIHNHGVIVGKCGIGKVNSAINTYRLIEEINPELIINSGVAGGVDGSLGVGSVLIADRIAYHDVWCGPGTKYGAADGFPQYMNPSELVLNKAKEIFENDDTVKFGLICSGDKFISKVEEVEEIKTSFPEAMAVDMESASIAQTCMTLGVSYSIVRVMSDTPGKEENISQYESFWEDAPEKTFKCVLDILEAI